MIRLLTILLCFGLQVQAQILPSNTVFDSTLASAVRVEPIVEPLLPHKMLFTQRIFWGPNGLFRVTDVAPLTAEGRRKELKVRNFMLISHEVTGYATVAGFVLQGILGAKLNRATGDRYDRLYAAQRTTATITNITYGTTALLSLTAPPKFQLDAKKRNQVKLHKYLAMIHLTGFVATNILAGKVAKNPELRPYQQVANFTTLAAFAPALIALKF